MVTRHKALGNQLGATAVATALATVGAGGAAYFGLWRLAFAVPGPGRRRFRSPHRRAPTQTGEGGRRSRADNMARALRATAVGGLRIV